MPTRRILLDECIDRRLVRKIIGHDVYTSPEMEWAGLKNGELLTNAEKDFDVFLTVDRNLAFQQNLPKFEIAVLVLHGRTNRLQDLIPLVPKILEALNNPQPGMILTISCITVGRPVTRPPPYRSPRAELPHGAPQSYSLRT